MDHEIGYEGYFYVLIGKVVDVMVDELFGLGLGLIGNVFKKDVSFSSSWLKSIWPEVASFGTGSLSSFIVVTNTLEIMIQTFAILFNHWLIKISITSSNNIRLTMFVKG